MKTIVVGVLVLTALAVAGLFALGDGDLGTYPACLACGADRKGCATSRMVVEFADGTRRGECGLRCVSEDLITQPGRRPRRFFVADNKSGRLIGAEEAFWVISGDGLECRNSAAKLAFKDKRVAQELVARHGGRLVDFTGAMQSTYREIYAQLPLAKAQQGLAER